MFIRFSILSIPLLIFTLFFTTKSAGIEPNSDKQDKVTEAFSDGPYIFVNDKGLDAHWLCQGQALSQFLALSPEQIGQLIEKPLLIDACNLSATIHTLNSHESAVLTFEGDFPVAALSDFHGRYDLMITLLTNNKIIDENRQWAFGNGHFVITGDIFDRGDKVTEILWFLYTLEQQAIKAGGKIHLTLGNHEVMILNGDLRYLHPKYIETAKVLNKPFETLFTPQSILGKWLRSKPVLVKVNNMLFAHGGFHPDLARDKRTLADINRVFKDNLVKSELDSPREGWAKFLHKGNGPIWYRGYFKDGSKGKGKQTPMDTGASSEEIDMLLAHFDVEHIIVGHTSQKQIETRYQGKVIAIDSSIKNGQYGEILFITNGKKWRGNLKGEVLPLAQN